MAIAAKISPTELTAQVTNRFDGAFLEARLINAPGVTYVPGTTDEANFLTFEVTPGTSGYQRKVISYTATDVSAYSDDGVALTTRATVFAHDGINSAIDFSHAALVWSQGNVLTLQSAPTGAPSSATNGTYNNIPVDSTSGNGVGLTVDLTVTNSGAALSDYSLAVNYPGYDYAIPETLTILNGTLQGLGVTGPSTGDLVFSPATVSNQSNAGSLLSVAETSSSVSLSGGNEAAFYWNLKQFGFYTVT